MQGHLALCCKATLPILCMGHVNVRTNRLERERPLLQATRCLTKQPDGVSHLEVSSRHSNCGLSMMCSDVSTHHLIDLRCALL